MVSLVGVGREEVRDCDILAEKIAFRRGGIWRRERGGERNYKERLRGLLVGAK